jgi:site-specific recombinase XerD
LLGNERIPSTLPELAPVFLKWFSLIRRRSENTCRAYQTDLAAFLAFCAQAGLTYPDDVKVSHIEFYQAVLLEKRGLQPVSVNRHLHALRSWWKWMQREEITVRNPADQAFLLKQPKRLPKYLPVPEQDRLFRALSRDHSPTGVRDYALHATLGFGGLRCSELSTLRLTDLDLESGVLRVIGKGDKAREIPLVPPLASILSDYLSDARPVLLHGRRSEYVFVRTGPWAYTTRSDQPLGPKAIFYVVRKTLKRVLGIEQAHPHMLRHSFASRVREHGGSIQDLQEVLGHSNIATTARYAHLVTSTQRNRLARLIAGTPPTRSKFPVRHKRRRITHEDVDTRGSQLCPDRMCDASTPYHIPASTHR